MDVEPRYIRLSDDDVADLKKFFKDQYDIEYSDEEAREAAQNFVGFFDFLVRLDERNKREGRYERNSE